MKKPLPLLLITLALVLAACAPQSASPSPSVPPATDASAVVQTTAPSATPEPEQPTTAAPASPELAGPPAPPGCTVVSQQETPAEDSPFEEISDQDWVQGPEDAYVSIIEYGDFQ